MAQLRALAALLEDLGSGFSSLLAVHNHLYPQTGVGVGGDTWCPLLACMHTCRLNTHTRKKNRLKNIRESIAGALVG